MTLPAFISGAVVLFLLIFPDTAEIWVSERIRLTVLGCFGHLTLLLQERWGVEQQNAIAEVSEFLLPQVPPGTCCRSLMVDEWAMEWFWVKHWAQRDKKWSLLSSAVAAAGQQRLACGSRAGGSSDPSGDASAESCACPLLWGEDSSLCSCCCDTTRAVWLQKLLYKLWKLDTNTCSLLGIENKANYIYYLDLGDLLFF